MSLSLTICIVSALPIEEQAVWGDNNRGRGRIMGLLPTSTPSPFSTIITSPTSRRQPVAVNTKAC